MLLEKYEPKSTKDIVGNAKQILWIKRWIKNWNGGALLVHGPTGVGKSLTIKLISKELDYELIEEDFLQSSKEKSIFHKGKILLVELDTIPNINIININEINCPMILITSDIYNERYRTLRKICKAIRFFKPQPNEIARYLKRICDVEGISVDINTIAKECDGDVRSALIDLEFGFHKRYKEKTTFEILRNFFRGEFEQDLNLELIEENICNEYDDEDIAKAFECLAKAEFFSSLVMKRQSWNLERYYYDFLRFFPKSKKDFVFYDIPYKKNYETESFLQNISKDLHVSKRKARIYLGLLTLLRKKLNGS